MNCCEPPIVRAKYCIRRLCHESQQAVIELTYNYGVTSYELGTGFDTS
jgi:hypothetical protein